MGGIASLLFLFPPLVSLPPLLADFELVSTYQPGTDGQEDFHQEYWLGMQVHDDEKDGGGASCMT